MAVSSVPPPPPPPPPDASCAPSSREERQSSLLQTLETDRRELERSLEVGQKFAVILRSLREKVRQAETENAKLRPKPTPEELQITALEGQIESEGRSIEAAQARVQKHTELAEQAHRRLKEHKQHVATLTASNESASAENDALETSLTQAVARRKTADQQARTMVSLESLHRCEEKEAALRSEVSEAQAQASRLRSALADTWALRTSCSTGPKSSPPESMSEELDWLAEMKTAAGVEQHKTRQLERQKVSLDELLKVAQEENAELHSRRMDLGDTGKAMREAIAHQSQAAADKIGHLAQARLQADADRKRLMAEITSMQEHLEDVAPALREAMGLESRQGSISQDRRKLQNESSRLRAVNSALTGQLLAGEDIGCPMPGADMTGGEVAESISRIIMLHRRLRERESTHNDQRQKTSDRIRLLERDALLPSPRADMKELEERRKQAAAQKITLPKSSYFGAAKEVWKGIRG